MKSFLLVVLVVVSSSSTTQAFLQLPPTCFNTNSRVLSQQQQQQQQQQPQPRLFVSMSTPQFAYAPSASDDYANQLSWDYRPVVDAVFEEDQRPVILFDGVCNLCNGGVNFALDNDKEGNFRFASLQSKIGQSLLVSAGRRPNDMSSIVLVRSSREAFFESDAILSISAGLGGNPLFQQLSDAGQWVPRLVRDAIYHVVSENRHLLGESDQCRLDFDGEFDDRFFPITIAAATTAIAVEQESKEGL